VLVTTCLRTVTSPGKRIQKSCKSQCIINSSFDITDFYCETTWHMRERDCSYIKNPQLILQLADREEEEAQQLPDIFLDRGGWRVQFAERFGAGSDSPSLVIMIISCLSWTELKRSY